MKLLIFSLLICLLACSVYAEEPRQADHAWCPSAENWPSPDWASPALVPDGGLVRVGERVFRSCTAPHSPPDAPRTVRLTLNPALLPEMLSVHAWTALTLSDLVPPDKWMANLLRSYIAVGTRVFGGTIYREYRHIETGEVEHSRRIFVYKPGLNPDLKFEPDHAISCPDKSPREGGAVTCFVFVYREGIRASAMMIGDGDNFSPAPRHEFPRIARDVRQVLRIADVTDKCRPSKAE